MKKDLTELVFILDKSGSMFGLEQDTIGGFNSLIEKQKKQQGEAIISTVLFNDEVDVINDKVKLEDVPLLTENEYYVDGCTALLDAIGITISKIISSRKETPECEHPEKTIIVITTDGMENASSEYNYKKINTLIKRQKEKYNWEFVFWGVNIDVIGEESKMGIDRDNAVAYCYDSEGFELNYECLGEAISTIRFKKNLSREWRSKIDKDYENRK